MKASTAGQKHKLKTHYKNIKEYYKNEDRDNMYNMLFKWNEKSVQLCRNVQKYLLWIALIHSSIFVGRSHMRALYTQSPSPCSPDDNFL